MDRITLHPVSIETTALREAFDSGDLPVSIMQALQAMVSQLITDDNPMSIYVCSPDEDAERRNLFAYALAKTLTHQVNSTVLVDLDFLHTGLHGIVPERDALGFLDFLLYGSSFGIIAQETNGGVRAVGAGSFPVTKRMPFIDDAFEEANRRLARQSQCVVYVGPLPGDEQALHPIIDQVDTTILIRDAARAPLSGTDRLEESIVTDAEVNLLSVRLSDAPAVVSASPLIDETEPVDDIGDDDFEPLQAPEVVVPPAPRSPGRDDHKNTVSLSKSEVKAHVDPSETQRLELPYHERPYTSALPKILVGIMVAVVIAFVAWWMYQERMASQAGLTRAVPIENQPVAAADTTTASAVDSVATDSGAMPENENENVGNSTASPEPAVAQPATQSPSPSPQVANNRRYPQPDVSYDFDPTDIQLMDDIEDRWIGQFLLHISSFRSSARAREEADYLRTQGVTTFIIYMDVGERGKWYRVYSGPFASRTRARDLKIALDENPRVKFTRIVEVGR